MTGRRWTKELRAAFRRDWLAGELSRSELCEKYETSAGHVMRLRKEMGLPTRNQGGAVSSNKPWPAERVELLKRLWPDKSLSIAAIARTLGVSRTAMGDWIRSHGRAHGIERRPFGGFRGERSKPVADAKPGYVRPVFESSIPWPDKARLMAGR